MKSRRDFLATTLSLLGGLTLPSLASAGTGPVIVEVANFQCPRCRSVNDHWERLDQAVRAKGGIIRFAPVAWESQSLWPDRVYYAARDLYPAAEWVIRDAIFDGIQREGQRFDELSQVMAYLDRRQLPKYLQSKGVPFELLSVADRAASDDSLLPEAKAGRLADMSGAAEVPVFLWLRDGEVVHVISPADASEPGPLVHKVLQKINEK